MAMKKITVKKVKPREKFVAFWVIFITLVIGIAIVIPNYPSWLNDDQNKYRSVLLLLYLFLEFIPMLSFISAITLPILSPLLLLPWIIVNICLLLFSSILILSLSLSYPSITNVLICLFISLVFIFPTLTIILMYLPIMVFIKRRIPNYKNKIRRSTFYRLIFCKKTAEEIEREIIWRRKEQIRNTIITDRDFEQFIFVNRAAQKWKAKIKKKDPSAEGNIFDEGNVTVNVGFQLDTVQEEVNNGDVTHADPTTNGDCNEDDGIKNGKIVTDV